MKEIKELNKWRETIFMYWKTQHYIKISILTKSIYSYSYQIPYFKIQKYQNLRFFCRYGQDYSKIYMEGKETRIASIVTFTHLTQIGHAFQFFKSFY